VRKKALNRSFVRFSYTLSCQSEYPCFFLFQKGAICLPTTCGKAGAWKEIRKQGGNWTWRKSILTWFLMLFLPFTRLVPNQRDVRIKSTCEAVCSNGNLNRPFGVFIGCTNSFLHTNNNCYRLVWVKNPIMLFICDADSNPPIRTSEVSEMQAYDSVNHFLGFKMHFQDHLDAMDWSFFPD